MKANNMYDKTKVQRSDKGSKIKNQEPFDLKEKKIKTSHDERDDGAKNYPTPDQRHEGFQFGTNPMRESSFERDCILREKRERELARERYVQGIQGTDGGKKPYETYNVNN